MARKHPTRLILAGLVICLMLGLTGCDDGNQPQEVQPIAVVDDPHQACPNGREVSFSLDHRGEQLIEDDVDGDGKDDRVWLSSDLSAPPGCQNFLTVETETTAYWVATDSSEVASSLQTPRLNLVSDIDGEPGAEVIADLEAGASTQFLGIFKLTGTGLERVVVDGKGPGPFAGSGTDLLPYGGSVGHLEAVDCSDDGYVVMSAAVPAGDGADRYVVERRFFTMTTSALVLEKEQTEKRTVSGLKIDDFPEFAASPFGSCE